MKLKTAIKNFEKGRKSPDDYMQIFFRDAYGRQQEICGKATERYGDCEVASRKTFQGRVMGFSLSALRMGKERLCRACAIWVDDEQAQAVQNELAEERAKSKSRR